MADYHPKQNLPWAQVYILIILIISYCGLGVFCFSLAGMWATNELENNYPAPKSHLPAPPPIDPTKELEMKEKLAHELESI